MKDLFKHFGTKCSKISPTEILMPGGVSSNSRAVVVSRAALKRRIPPLHKQLESGQISQTGPWNPRTMNHHIACRESGVS